MEYILLLCKIPSHIHQSFGQSCKTPKILPEQYKMPSSSGLLLRGNGASACLDLHHEYVCKVD